MSSKKKKPEAAESGTEMPTLFYTLNGQEIASGFISVERAEMECARLARYGITPEKSYTVGEETAEAE